MRYCTKCGTGFGGGVERCPRDGALLLEKTIAIEADELEPELARGGPAAGAGGAVAEGTADLAGEIEDIIFRSCPTCHTSFGGLLELCPHDGSRLAEHSLLVRETLIHGPDAAGRGGESLIFRKYCITCKKRFPLHQKTCEGCGAHLAVPTIEVGGGAPARESRSLNGEAGQLIDGKYRLVQDIGIGGFGSVFLSKHESLGKRYAVKMLKSELSDLTSFRDRFHEEALKLSRLEDENIVKVIDFGEWQDFQYMVTEFVEGKDLGAVIYAEKIAPLRAAKILRQVAGALAEAHSKGIVHLDLKPPNVLVSQKRGRDLVKVIDFGIAELYSEKRQSRQQKVCGTSTYMAPEQWRRDHLTPRADLYSLGVIGYELLAGRPPFRQALMSEIERAHLQEAPAPLRKLRPDVPPELERLVLRCLEKDPAKRYRSAEEVEEALDAYIRRSENVSLRRLKVAGLAAAILVFLGAGSWGAISTMADKELPRWVEQSVHAGGREGKAIVGVLTGSTGRYVTRSPEVTITLAAADNRAVDHLWVEVDGAEQTIAGGEAAIPLKLIEGKVTLVQARAFDRAGNPGELKRYDLERPAPPTFKAGLIEFRPQTREESVKLLIESLQGAEAIVRRRDAEGELWEVSVAKTEDNSYRFSGPGAEKQKQPLAGEPAQIDIPLRRGRNQIEVRRKDLFSGEEIVDPETSKEVNQLRSPVPFKASLLPEENGVFPGSEPGTWFSRKREVSLELAIDGAAGRIDEKTYLRYRLNHEPDLPLSSWDAKELASGKKIVRIPLPQEGNYLITLEKFQDRYGNESEPLRLEVVLDETPPAVAVPTPAVDFGGGDLPAVPFYVSEDHLDPGNIALEARDGDGWKGVDPRAYRFDAAPDGSRSVRFLDAALFAAEGKLEFRIRAGDRAGNSSGEGAGRFAILVDRTDPAIEILSPLEGESFLREATVEVVARVNDVFPKGLKVEAVMTVNFLTKEVKRSVDLNPEGDFWKARIPVEKPDTFEDREPSFRLRVTARDATNHVSGQDVALRFAWQNRDRLRWKKDGSVLIYHEACKARDVGPFWMAETETTNRQFQKFIDELKGAYPIAGASGPRSSDWEGGKCKIEKLDLPARGISWVEVEAYCRWSGLTLPRDLEWRIAAFWDYEIGNERPFPWGAKFSAKNICGSAREPAPAADASGQFKGGRTPFGLLHMLGNVRELVLDDQRDPVPVGGGFDTREERFRNQTYGGTLNSPEEAHDNQGFRSMLEVKGSP